MNVRAIERLEIFGLPGVLRLPAPLPTKDRVYAIAFDLDTETLELSYPNTSWQNGYGEIRRILEDEGFTHQQGSVYFGGERIDATTCVLAAQRLARELPWFSVAVRDVRMLRIEEANDLGPALQRRP